MLPKFLVVLGVVALLLVIIGCVLMITDRLAPWSRDADLRRVLRTVRAQLSVHDPARQVRVVGRPAR